MPATPTARALSSSRPVVSVLAISAVSVAAIALAACGGGASSGASAAAPSAPVAPGREPVAAMRAADGRDESFTLDDGKATPFLYFEAARVRLSSDCKKGDALECDAYRTLRNAAPVELPAREVGGGTSAGTKICTKLGGTVADGTNSVGSQDGFCRFGDGSLVSAGALEQYLLRVFE